jgi:hypothetical protein
MLAIYVHEQREQAKENDSDDDHNINRQNE